MTDAASAEAGSPDRATRFVAVLTVASTAVLTWAGTLDPIGLADLVQAPVALLVGLGIVSIVFPLRLHHGDETSGVSLVPAVAFTLAVLGPDGVAVAAAAGMAMVGTGAVTRSVTKTAFNVAQNIIGATAAVVAARLVLGGPVAGDVLSVVTVAALGVAALVYNLSNLVLVSEVLHRVTGDGRRQLAAEMLGPGLWNVAGDLAGALLLTVLAERSAVAMLLALPMFAGIQLSYRGVATDREAARQAQVLQRISRRLLDGALDRSALDAAVETLTNLLHADRAVLVLEGAAPAWLAEAADEVRRTGQPLLRGEAPGLLATPVRVDGAVVGVLGVSGHRGVTTWGSGHVDLLATVAGEIAATLRTRRLLQDLERERARLAAETAKLNDVLRSASDGIVVLDGAGRVVAWNPAMAGVTGEHDDVLGRPWRDVLRLEREDGTAVAGLADHPLAGALRGHHPVERATVALRRADGTRRWLRCSVAPIHTEGRPDGVVLVAVDLTREREVEELRRDFIATVSHELRTPLTPLRGFLSVIGEHGGSLEEDRLRTMVRAMEKQVGRLSDLIGDLLQVAEVDRVSRGFDLETVDLTRIAHDVVDVEAVAAEERGRVVVVGRSVHVVADKDAVRRAVRALVSNGIKHTSGLVAVVVDEGTERGVVRVRDEGPRIPEDARDLVFEPFRRLGDHLHRTQGAGLGLAVARSLAEAMGGRLELGVSPEGGNEFTLTLPALPDAPPGAVDEEVVAGAARD